MKMHQLAWLMLGPLALCAQAQTATPTPAVDPTPGWQLCGQHADAATRLACFDRWVQEQAGATPAAPPAAVTLPAPAPQEATPATRLPNCRSGPQSVLSRFWELEDGSDCGRFNIRGYKPISLSWVQSDTVNRSPSSPTEGHSASGETPYIVTEGRIQLSVRTKVGQGFLPVTNFGGRDSLWFAYSQQSYWQLFTSSISRPFRTTDHEPELIYIVPTPIELPGGWQLRYSGVSINHQSNGQSLPLSRSWNRAILMAGMEKDNKFVLNGRLWNRITDGDEVDDNPGIDDLIGRAELTGGWQVNPEHTLLLTLRHSMRGVANGSWRMEWMRTLGNDARSPNASALRLHVQLFSGYGDSLVDYNRGRTLLSVGLSLVDW